MNRLVVLAVATAGLLLAGRAALSQTAPELPSDYSYLTRIHVKPVVVNCVAEIDRWIRTAARYDMFIAPDRRLLQAKSRDGDGTFSDRDTQPVESIVTILASARIRSRGAWIPVVARCGLWHAHVVGVSVKPRHIAAH